MPEPELNITIGDRGEAVPQPGDVGALMASFVAERGPADIYTTCLSLSKVKAVYGDVDSGSYGIRNAEAYFREANGAGRLLAKRLVGPAATSGTLALSSAAPAVVMTLTAAAMDADGVLHANPGAWSTELTVEVLTGAGSTRTVTFKQDGATLFSEAFTTATALEDAFEATGLVSVATGVGVWPLAVLAETALSAGADDRASIPTTQAGWLAELAIFDGDAPTGTVSLPGITTPAAHAALVQHAESFRRFAALDAIDTATVASLTAPAATLRALGSRAGYGAMYAPWEKIPGPGTGLVTVPPSGAQAGRMAAADRENRPGPGQPAAQSFGVMRFVADVTQTWSKADRDTLHDAGVTVTRNDRGRIYAVGSRTLADPDVWEQYSGAAGVRVVLAVADECEDDMQKYLEKNIDPALHIYSEVQKDLVGRGSAWYARDALFGATAGEAFAAIVGAGSAPRSLAANLAMRPTTSVKTIDLLITTVAPSDEI